MNNRRLREARALIEMGAKEVHVSYLIMALSAYEGARAENSLLLEENDALKSEALRLAEACETIEDQLLSTTDPRSVDDVSVQSSNIEAIDGGDKSPIAKNYSLENDLSKISKAQNPENCVDHLVDKPTSFSIGEDDDLPF